jgi:hypothetical protein
MVILHAREESRSAGRYAIDTMIRQWRHMGVEVIQLYGMSTFVEADLAFVHVDRSLVPEDYIAFARRYPRAVNAGATDIRKRGYADGVLDSASAYAGPVIVKTDLNYAGAPERQAVSPEARHTLSARLERLRPRPLRPIRSKADYFLAPSLKQVPKRYFAHEHIVQEFRPERDGEDFLLREYIFLGDIHYENVERSRRPIFEEDRHVSLRRFTPHPKLVAVRDRLGLDYGKIDYSMIDGEPFVFDANKTLGRGADDSEAVDDMLRLMASRLVAPTAAG